MKKTTLQIVKEMEQALERAEVDCSDYFHDDFDWIANFGCGTKRGLDEFERAWYKPFRDAFGDRHFATEHYLEDVIGPLVLGTAKLHITVILWELLQPGSELRYHILTFGGLRKGKLLKTV